MEEKELFEEYEVRNWDMTPRLYKIFGIATAINVLIIFAFAQFNLLNRKGCDTPFFGIVCQALDSAYIATTFMGSDFKGDEIAYDKTEIGDEDIVTLIDVGDRLEYPAGYFALANPDTANGDPLSDGGTPLRTVDPSPNSADLLNKPQVIPTPNDNVASQDIPKDLFKIGDEPEKPSKTPNTKRTPKGSKNPILGESPNTLPGDKTVATNPTPPATPTPSEKELQDAKDNFVKGFNKKPLQDFADGVIARLESEKPEEKVDLTQPFKVVLDGTLTKEGKFDAEKTRFIGKGEGNEQMVNVAKSAIEAMGDSAIFSYLITLGVEKVNITLVQDEKEISAVIRSSQPTPEKAKTISSGFNGLIMLANINTKDDKDVQALLKATKFTAEGKSFVINFMMPKDDAHKLIDQKLQEARQKKLQNNNEGAKDQSNQGK